MEKTHGHYPAPLAALDAVQAGYSRGLDRRSSRRGAAVRRDGVTDVSRQLVFLFFASNALKKDPGVDPPAPPPRRGAHARRAGAGFMGAGHRVDRRAAGHAACDSRTPTRRASAKVSRRFAACIEERLLAQADHAAAVRRLPEPRRRHDRLLGLRVGRSRDRGGVRGSRAQASRARGGRTGDRADGDLRVEHEHDSDHADRRGRATSGARARDALLLARAQDAAARGDRDAADRSPRRR